MKIPYEDIAQLYNRLREAIDIWHRKNVPNSEIQILVPGYILGAIAFVNEAPPSFVHGYSDIPLFPRPDFLDIQKYCGISIAPHYTNEAVVFCKNWYFYDRLAEPLIIQLPNYKNEENRNEKKK